MEIKKANRGKLITITLDEKWATILEQIASDRGLKKSALISLWVEEYSKKEVKYEDK